MLYVAVAGHLEAERGRERSGSGRGRSDKEGARGAEWGGVYCLQVDRRATQASGTSEWESGSESE